MKRRKFDKKFKATIVSLLDSRKKTKDICSEYDLNDGFVRKWRRGFTNETGDFKDDSILVYEQ